jgi:type VI secretion system secreted protein VgrG
MEKLKQETVKLRKQRLIVKKAHARPSLYNNRITPEEKVIYGTVTDNKDPEKLGRVKVTSDAIAPSAVTQWIPVIAPGAGKDTGWWQLPEIGSHVLLAFVGTGRQTPIVLGNIYDINLQPPKHTAEKVKDSKVWQSKAHRVEFTDEGGKESVIVSNAKGKMRIALSKDKGIELINELGEIKIKCRKLKIDGGKGVQWEGKKKVKIKGEDEGKIKCKKGVQIENGKEVKVKGKNIKLEGSKGITTEGKQIAAEGDKVMGMDVHQMVVPSGKGTDVIPLPHPFIGKLADKLSKDVKIKGHNAAVKGSVAKHDNPVHNQLPGTIKFQKDPKKDGEVTGGTGSKVKINGKEAAVIGSTVTTCNDMGVRDNSVILAVGASVPMPVIINPKNTKEYKLEREKENKKKPEFTGAKWVKANVKEGEEAELTAQVKDIEDGNMVTFQVWKEGQDPAVNVAVEQVTAVIEGGTAKGKWKLFVNGNEMPPDKDPKYFFTAHSAWCPYKKSGNMTVELKRPEVTKCEWHDEEGKSTDKGLVGKPLKLTASFNGDAVEGAGATFRVYKEGDDLKGGKPVYEAGAEIKGGKAEAEWTYRYRRDPENPLKEKPKYFFTVNSPRCKEAKSGNAEIGMEVDIPVCNWNGECYAELEYTLTGVDGTEEKKKTDKEGRIKSDTLLPGDYEINLDMENYQNQEDDEPEKIALQYIQEQYNVIRINAVDMEAITCRPGLKYLVIIKYEIDNISY